MVELLVSAVAAGYSGQRAKTYTKHAGFLQRTAGYHVMLPTKMRKDTAEQWCRNNVTGECFLTLEYNRNINREVYRHNPNGTWCIYGRVAWFARPGDAIAFKLVFV